MKTHKPLKSKQINREVTLPKYSDDIITARPPEMSYEKYVEIRRNQNNNLKKRVKEGFIFYKSWEKVIDDKNKLTGFIRKFRPFKKEV